jgi:hypothetical protein
VYVFVLIAVWQIVLSWDLDTLKKVTGQEMFIVAIPFAGDPLMVGICQTLTTSNARFRNPL